MTIELGKDVIFELIRKKRVTEVEITPVRPKNLHDANLQQDLIGGGVLWGEGGEVTRLSGESRFLPPDRVMHSKWMAALVPCG